MVKDLGQDHKELLIIHRALDLSNRLEALDLSVRLEALDHNQIHKHLDKTHQDSAKR